MCDVLSCKASSCARLHRQTVKILLVSTCIVSFFFHVSFLIGRSMTSSQLQTTSFHKRKRLDDRIRRTPIISRIPIDSIFILLIHPPYIVSYRIFHYLKRQLCPKTYSVTFSTILEKLDMSDFRKYFTRSRWRDPSIWDTYYHTQLKILASDFKGHDYIALRFLSDSHVL